MPIYVYECDQNHRQERFLPVSEYMQQIRCLHCGKKAQQIITLPAIHTLGTFSQDILDADVQRTRDPGDGSYFDPNIVNPKTGKPERITSKGQRERLLKQAGLYEKGESDRARDVAIARQKKTKYYTGGSQNG